MSPEERVKKHNIRIVGIMETAGKAENLDIILRPFVEELKRGFKGINIKIYTTKIDVLTNILGIELIDIHGDKFIWKFFLYGWVADLEVLYVMCKIKLYIYLVVYFTGVS